MKSTVYFQENAGWAVVNGNIVAFKRFFFGTFQR